MKASAGYPAELEKSEINRTAKSRILSIKGDPYLRADWLQLLMIHYKVEPASLQGIVPFNLDLYEGQAWISLVAFTLSDMRFHCLGKVGKWLLKPIATHEFLNVRTYVKVRGEAGIYFLAEWLPNRFSVLLGPTIFGLPYRYGRLNYRHDADISGVISGCVSSKNSARGALKYEACIDGHLAMRPTERSSLDEWLMERYTAFTRINRKSRFFRVWHEPYLQSRARVTIANQSLIEIHWPMMAGIEPTHANFSPGVFDVWMGRPHSVNEMPCNT